MCNSYYKIDLQIDDEYANELAEIDTEICLAIEKTLQQQAVSEAALTIVITTDDVVRRLNRDYRGTDSATDVLSFSNHAAPAAELPANGIPDQAATPQLLLPPELIEEQALFLGDILIAYPYAARQAEKFGSSITAELQLLAIHGTLHLLGFDHETAPDKAIMWAHQDAVLFALGLAPTDAKRSDEEYSDEGSGLNHMADSSA